MEQKENPLRLCPNTGGAMTARQSSNLKTILGIVGFLLPKKSYPHLFSKIINTSKSNFFSPKILKHTTHICVSIFQEYTPICTIREGSYSLFVVSGASPDEALLYLSTSQEKFQQFLQSLDGKALAEWAVIRMKRG